MQKRLKKRITCAKREYDKDGKRKHQDKSKLLHERRHSSGKHHQDSQKACSAHAPYHRTTEAPTGPVCQGYQKADQKTQPDRQRGQGSEH
eukprot:810443-Ditylum_brightwellii.AAC.1